MSNELWSCMRCQTPNNFGARCCNPNCNLPKTTACAPTGKRDSKRPPYLSNYVDGDGDGDATLTTVQKPSKPQKPPARKDAALETVLEEQEDEPTRKRKKDEESDLIRSVQEQSQMIKMTKPGPVINEKITIEFMNQVVHTNECNNTPLDDNQVVNILLYLLYVNCQYSMYKSVKVVGFALIDKVKKRMQKHMTHMDEQSHRQLEELKEMSEDCW